MEAFCCRCRCRCPLPDSVTVAVWHSTNALRALCSYWLLATAAATAPADDANHTE